MRFVLITEKERRYFQSFDLLMCLDIIGVHALWGHMGYTADFRKMLENNKEYEGPEKAGWDTMWDTHIDMDDASFRMKNYSGWVSEILTGCGMRIFVVPYSPRPPSPRNDPRNDDLLNDYSGRIKWWSEQEDSQNDDSAESAILGPENGRTENVRCLDVSSFCKVVQLTIYMTLSDHAKIRAGISRLRRGESDVFSYHDDGPPGQSSLRRRLTIMHCGGELPSWAIVE